MELFCRTDCIWGWIEGISDGENNCLLSQIFSGFMMRICTKTVWASLMLRTATLLQDYVFIWNLNWKTTSSVTVLKFIIYWLPVESKENLKTLVPGKVPLFFLDYQNNLALSYFCVKVRLVYGLLPHLAINPGVKSL